MWPGIFQIKFLNVSDSPLDLHAGKYVGNLVSSRNASAHGEPSALIDQINSAKNLNDGEHLPKDQRSRLETLIKENNDIFASSPKKPALVRNAEQRVITQGIALPVDRKRHRLPEAWYKEVNTQIQEVLVNEIIRPSGIAAERSHFISKKEG